MASTHPLDIENKTDFIEVPTIEQLQLSALDQYAIGNQLKKLGVRIDEIIFSHTPQFIQISPFETQLSYEVRMATNYGVLTMVALGTDKKEFPHMDVKVVYTHLGRREYHKLIRALLRTAVTQSPETIEEVMENF